MSDPKLAGRDAEGAALRGSWPAGDIRRVFVDGAKWWQFHAHHFTAFPSEVDEMEAEATKRFGVAGGEAVVAGQHEAVLWRCDTCGYWLHVPTASCSCPVVDKRPMRYLARPSEDEARAAPPDVRHAALTNADIDQIIEGIEHFCIGPQNTQDLIDIWQPYIDKLNQLRAPSVQTRDTDE